jgi:hypothetical protein
MLLYIAVFLALVTVISLLVEPDTQRQHRAGTKQDSQPKGGSS